MNSKRYVHIWCPAGVESKYSVIVLDPQNSPFLPLTDFYADLIGRVGDKTALSYLTSLESYFSWLDVYARYQGRNVRWDEHPEIVRETIQDYLFNEMDCKVRDKDSYRLVSLTNKSPNTVSRILSALKAFYKTMIRLKYYAYANPLLHAEDFLEVYQELQRGIRKDKPRLPDAAGTEEPIQHHRRLTDSYFKVVNEEWIPIIIGDWDLPYKIYNAGKRIGWSIRDEVITRLLFETGARASEVIELTFGDYRMRANQTEARAPNKGSHKKRTKYIRFSQETLKLLIRYVNSERKKSTKFNLGFDDVPEDEPIFVTEHGRPFKYPAYYAQWQKIVGAAGLKLNPHKARHCYVTTMMRSIFETSKDDAEIARKKKELIQYMRWRDEATIEVYEHYFNEIEFGEVQTNIFNNMRQKEIEYTTKRNSAAKKIAKVVPMLKSVETTEEENWLLELMEGITK